MIATLAEYKGKPIEELTKEELIVALRELFAYYESRLAGENQLINFLKKRTP